MLTNLDWLNKGSTYPPPSEKARIEMYKQNENLFLTQHPEVLKKSFEEIAQRLRKKKYDVETIFNYQQLLSKKTADFICSEPPTFESAGNTDALVELLEKQKFNIKLYEAFIEIGRAHV